MAKREKNSFILFYEWEDSIRSLTDEQAGQLLRALFAYEKRGEQYTGGDPAVELAMGFLYASLDRNREKYEETCRKRSAAGKKGGAPKGNQNARKDENKQNKQKQAKQPDSDSDSDSERDSERVSESGSDSERDSSSPGRADGTETVLQFFRDHVFPHPTVENQKTIVKWCEEIGTEKVVEAMKIAEANGVKGWNYCEAILKNWRKERKSHGDGGEPVDGSGPASRWGNLPGIKRL